MRMHLIASLTAAVVLAACSSTPPAPVQPAAAPAPAAARPAPAPAASAPAAAAPAPRPAPPKVDPYDPSQLKNAASLLSKRSIYFEYDKFDISDDYQPLVVTHALFLTKNPTYKAQIQGNADERGSREYNLALGQKRADSVKKALMALGAKDSQLETISFGEEKPRNTNKDDAGWFENRRADIMYMGEY